MQCIDAQGANVLSILAGMACTRLPVWELCRTVVHTSPACASVERRWHSREVFALLLLYQRIWEKCSFREVFVLLCGESGESTLDTSNILQSFNLFYILWRSGKKRQEEHSLALTSRSLHMLLTCPTDGFHLSNSSNPKLHESSSELELH